MVCNKEVGGLIWVVSIRDRNSSRPSVREILDAILHIVRLESFGDHLQIAHGLANGNSELVRLHDATESRACLQTPMRN
jgi:hypothetical protein